jgi:hypothetical protein
MGESMDFGWIMISLVKSTFKQIHFTFFRVIYTYKLISYSSSFLQSHLRVLFTMKKKKTAYNISRYNIDNNKNE